MSATDGELVVEYAPTDKPRRRLRFAPIDASPFAYRMIEEEYAPDGWREVGNDTVDDVDVDDQRAAVRLFAGP